LIIIVLHVVGSRLVRADPGLGAASLRHRGAILSECAGKVKPERSDRGTTSFRETGSGGSHRPLVDRLGSVDRSGFAPFVEFRTTTPTVAEDHRTQVTIVPGLNMKPFARSTLAVGVQLPVTNAREFDYQVRVLFIKEF